MINQSHPVHLDFEACTTHALFGHCYASQADAISAFEAALTNHVFHLATWSARDFDGDQGCKIVMVLDELGIYVADAAFTWYKVAPGEYEFTGYLK